MSRKRTRSESPTRRPPAPSTTTQFFRSSPIKDRSSTFIAFYSLTVSAKELQGHAEFKSASHRIAAWRMPSNQGALPFHSISSRRVYDSGHDDDGEKFAGKRLEKVMQDMNAEGAVVVARWYGGVLLGPVRFNHIEHCAREAILESRRAVHQGDSQIQAMEKKTKFDEEPDRTSLTRTLEERDQSISVLRGLLKEKMASVEPSGAASQAQRQ